MALKDLLVGKSIPALPGKAGSSSPGNLWTGRTRRISPLAT